MKICCQPKIFIEKNWTTVNQRAYAIQTNANANIFDRNVKRMQKERAAKE